VLESELNGVQIKYETSAYWIGKFEVQDPESRSPVELSVYKHENGGIFAIDSSFIGQAASPVHPEIDDSDVVIPDPLAEVVNRRTGTRRTRTEFVRLIENGG